MPAGAGAAGGCALAPSSDSASTAAPTPWPTTLAVPTATSAANPTAVAVTLTAVAVTVTTVQPGSSNRLHRPRKAPRARRRGGWRGESITLLTPLYYLQVLQIHPLIYTQLYEINFHLTFL